MVAKQAGNMQKPILAQAADENFKKKNERGSVTMWLLLSESRTRFWKLPGRWCSIKLQQNSRIWIIQAAFFAAGCRRDSGFCVCLKTDNTGFSLSGSHMTHTLLEWSKPSIHSLFALQSCSRARMKPVLKANWPDLLNTRDCARRQRRFTWNRAKVCQRVWLASAENKARGSHLQAAEALIGFCYGFPPGEIKDIGTLSTVQFSPHFLQQCPLEDASSSTQISFMHICLGLMSTGVGLACINH